MQAQSFYDAIGGAPTFHKLVHRFYELVAEDDLLYPMYPEYDMDGAEDRLRMFLEQYWGGPRTYTDQRGHPRLKLRHVEFHVDEEARDAWLRCMRESLGEIDSETIDDAHRAELWDYLEAVANFLINVPG